MKETLKIKIVGKRSIKKIGRITPEKEESLKDMKRNKEESMAK